MLEPDVDDGPTGPAADLLRRKVKETLELDLDAPELHDALEVVSEFWQGNTAENRRNLRSDLERRTVEQAEAFVEHYRPLRDALAGSEAMAAELEAHVAATAGELREREAENRRVVAAHDALVAERDALAAKREATVAFLARFQLGERERDALAAGDFEDAEDADDFFAALARAAGALADLDRALADGSRCFADAVGCGETVRPSAGVGAELRDLLREATDGAHERLLAFALRALGGDATTAADAAAAAAACEAVAQDPRSAPRRALEALRRSPALDARCREACAPARRELCKARLRDALGAASPGGDPERYAADRADTDRRTSDCSSSVPSESIRPMFGRIDGSRRVLEARLKRLRRNCRVRAH